MLGALVVRATLSLTVNGFLNRPIFSSQAYQKNQMLYHQNYSIQLLPLLCRGRQNYSARDTMFWCLLLSCMVPYGWVGFFPNIHPISSSLGYLVLVVLFRRQSEKTWLIAQSEGSLAGCCFRCLRGVIRGGLSWFRIRAELRNQFMQ